MARNTPQPQDQSHIHKPTNTDPRPQADQATNDQGGNEAESNKGGN